MLVRLISSGCVVCCCLALTASVPAQTIDNATVSILDSFTAFTGYDVDLAIDTGPDAIFSDYASQGGSIDTFLERRRPG